MLTLTDEATDLIARLAHDNAVPDEGGLRIERREDHPALRMYLTDHPEPRDLVVRRGKATVFLAPIAAKRLDRQTLGARTNDVGAAFFLE